MVSSRVPCVPLTRDTDAMLSRTVHFLPSAAQAAFLGPAAVETSKAIERLGAGIRRHRRPTAEACADAGRTTRLPLREGGFGSTLSSLIKPYLWSLLQARVPLSAQPLPQVGSRTRQYKLVPVGSAPLENFVNRSTCADASLECFLLPLSNCSAATRHHAPAPALGGRWGDLSIHDQLLGEAKDKAIAGAARAAGRFGTVSLLLTALLQPSAALRRATCAARRAVKWPRRAGGGGGGGLGIGKAARRPLLLGLHVRRGDACDTEALGRHNRSCSPLAAYMPAPLELHPLSGLTAPYLETPPSPQYIGTCPRCSPRARPTQHPARRGASTPPPPPPPPPPTPVHPRTPPRTHPHAPAHTLTPLHTPYTPLQVHVYLATDDHTVVDDLPKVNGSRHFTWLVRSSDEVRRTWPRRLHAPMLTMALTMATLLGAQHVAARLPYNPSHTLASPYTPL